MKQAKFLLVLGMGMYASVAWSTEPKTAGDEAGRLQALEKSLDEMKTETEALAKAVDDVLWFHRVGDVAEVDKVTIVGPPNPKDEARYGIANERHPFKIYVYLFSPRQRDRSRRNPLILLPHGGVHANFTTYYAHIVREMVEQGYVIVAPEYRGSTGYGRGFYQAIDYGGLETDDVVAARDWAVENLEYVDAGRVAIVGWSHGGLIALLAANRHPKKFQAVYAGVPVSDLVARMGYQDDEYRAEFSAQYHIGKTAEQDVDEYRRRSPVWNVDKIEAPLLIHTTTNDRDVNVVEVEHLIRALKVAGKTFEHRIYQDAPGGHSFNRIDTPFARESRHELYRFLERHLNR